MYNQKHLNTVCSLHPVKIESAINCGMYLRLHAATDSTIGQCDHLISFHKFLDLSSTQ